MHKYFKYATQYVTLIAFGLFANPALLAAPQTQAQENDEVALIDLNDHYYDTQGRAIRFFRKKDRYFLIDSLQTARQNRAARRIAEKNPDAPQLNFAPRALGDASLKRVLSHAWGALDIVKQDPAIQAARRSGIGGSNNSAVNTQAMAPVFSNANGDELLILPDIIVQFASKQDVAQHQQALLDQFDMRIKNQMMFSETDFVLAFDAPLSDFSNVFQTTRAIMDLPYINWAEPNMLVHLEKTATPDPDDYLYRDQWGLFSWGQNGELCNANTGIAADIDANDAWDLMKSLNVTNKPVIAIIDDGVDLTHKDLPIWTNPSPSTGIPDPDPDLGTTPSGNFCKDDTKGCNFGDFYITAGIRVYNYSNAATIVHPSPQTSDDIHGTQAAGIAAAKRNNKIGIAGSAYNAEILPIRLDFSTLGTDCVAIGDALLYAAKYADVISNSWRESSGACTSILNGINSRLTTITAGDTTFKRGTKGTPVVFASGNSAAGWRKISMTVPSSGTLRFTLHKALFTSSGENAVWLDNIKLPGSGVQSIGSSLPSASWKISGSGSYSASGNYAACSTTSSGTQPVAATGNHTIGGTGHSIKLAAAANACQYLEISGVSGGTLSFWVWDSTNTWDAEFFDDDLFRVYVNNSKIGEDLTTRGTASRGINIFSEIEHDTLAYPASHSGVISVGASNKGKDTQNGVQIEDRAYFSQYGATLDVLAPGVSIRSTKNGNSYGSLSGTSAAAPMVAGVIANMLAVDPSLSLADIKTHLHDGADEIGPKTGEFAYSAGFNKYYGYGRLNSYRSVQLANGTLVGGLLSANELCEDPNPGAANDDFLLLIIPAIVAGALKNK